MFVEIFLIGILSGLSPGPDFFLVMKNSLGFGQRIGIATALGVASALFVHVTYTVLGFTYIIEKIPSVFIAIKIAGPLYLLWLGFHAIRSVKQNKEQEEQGLKTNEDKTVKQGFREGFICNVLNPKAALFFLSIFSQFISADTASWVRWAYGTEIVIAVGLWFIFISTVISYQKFRNYYERYSHWFDRCLGAILIYFAVFIAYSTIHS
ncbi:LysE family translocator [Priestia megaterium]|uniref:LysE family translocator n=1 Tax=Priestia megaterium TaxID=1404 RepID=UPI002E1A5636|nr:LysE family transporter [Priestia megaterium]MED4240863.1 LysE family transporter [Priestia megaterium]MED4268304.1 LysE family transporter [Priestia megaterium]MED4280227.1 LysE family transporter [Priestia megaterium]MED4319573.1 LysE family transporter [Priestia megaterium]